MMNAKSRMMNGNTAQVDARFHQVIVVGGGAGGVELATRLGDTLGRKGKARVTLVDRSRTHLWKPLLHEFAAGTMDLEHHALDYLAQARWHHFRFQLGEMDGLDRVRRVVAVAPICDEDGRELIPRREIAYDTLVEAKPRTICKLGPLEQRFSYASWTAPSHYNLLRSIRSLPPAPRGGSRSRDPRGRDRWRWPNRSRLPGAALCFGFRPATCGSRRGEP